jgi:demethylspheroidene O-methyltransferase
VNSRSLLSILFHADKALDLVGAAHRLGLFASLESAPMTLRELTERLDVRPLRLYKMLDGLESLGLVVRQQPTDELLDAQYRAAEPLTAAAEAVLGARSIERDRNDNYPWREIYGRLPEVLEGQLDARFAWPPRGADDLRAFERSMAAGCPPIIEALTAMTPLIFDEPRTRWLDVGGGDGTVAVGVLTNSSVPHAVRCDVFNLPAAAPLVHECSKAAGLTDRVGFVGGDFFGGPLPHGYNVLSFIRVLHDWPANVARQLLAKARDALPPGGRLIICEEFRTADRLAVQFFWTYFLIGVDACVSRLREVEWYTQALVELGFSEVAVVPGAFDVIVATRR